MVALALGSAVGLSSGPAAAQAQSELDRARSLFRQGLSLEAAGNWAAALAKFDEVGRVKLTPQVRFHVARCNEQLGRLNEALGEYRMAEYEAGEQNLTDLPAITQARQSLETRIPKLVIQRGAGAETAQIELDGVALGEKEIGQPVSVDPGPHRIVAKLSLDREFEQSTVVKESETAQVVLVAPASLGAAPEEPPTTSPYAAATPGKNGSPAEARRKPTVLPWVIGGVGAAGLVGSGVFYLMRQSEKNALDEVCRADNVCPASAKDKQDKGQLYTTLSMVSLGVGVVGVGVATYLFISGSQQRREQALVPLDVAALPGGGAFTVRGRF